MFKKILLSLTVVLLMSLDSYASQSRVYCVDIIQDDNKHILKQSPVYKSYVNYLDDSYNSNFIEKEEANVITYSFCALKWDEELVKSFEDFKRDLIFQMSIIHSLTLDLKKENILNSYNKLEVIVSEEAKKSIEEQKQKDRETIKNLGK